LQVITQQWHFCCIPTVDLKMGNVSNLTEPENAAGISNVQF